MFGWICIGLLCGAACVSGGFVLGATWAGLGWHRREIELLEAHREELFREKQAIERARQAGS